MRRSVGALLMALALASCTASPDEAATTAPRPSTTSPPATTVPTTAPPTTAPTTTPPTTTAPTTTTTTLAELSGLAYEKVADLPFPIHVVAIPGDDLAYVAGKAGVVWVMEDGDVDTADPVLDINERVRNDGEQGLLAIAIAPDGEHLYTHYSANDGDTVVSEFDMVGARDADPESERVLLRLNQPARNHNGGMIQLVGEVLYLGLGDGGGSNDNFGHGQNTGTLLGGLVTLSVVGDPTPTLHAFGLRNPWRFWIEDGLIYIADVGQRAFEEISVSTLEPGQNYGWSILEGDHCFRSSNCDRSGTVLPVVEIPHTDSGTCSITGGVVYRGQSIPELDGLFFYSDYCGGYLRSFRYSGGEAVDLTDWTGDIGVAGRVVSFGVDGAGEVYVATPGSLYRLIAVR